ncbi:ribonuclease P protein component [Asanoa ishikariensis]|uniref:Ribonuclease P protein component n=1 Tax=Asanoa ishikariensis TaxID=137265 RepID=A0A1H3KFS5_9ACTN|nr:ribonuclease P protein component [Asanoa ishikariensis]GIF70360.1 ribonuclease P protein component [Asanoa ishikariensis]SDY50997.1 ribonuclease P protein component [Asanoa ishikariensis]
MLAAAQRLRRRAEFSTAVRTGRSAGRGAVVVHLTLPSQPTVQSQQHPESHPHDLDQPTSASGAATATPPARVGFVVSKAVGGAVVRNQVKRRLRHLARERLETLPAGTTLVVRALPRAADRSYQRLGVDLDKAIALARDPAQGDGRRPRRSGRERS